MIGYALRGRSPATPIVWASLPAASANTDVILPVRIGSYVGMFYSNGTYWLPVGGSHVIDKGTGLSMTTPADINDNEIKKITLPAGLCVPGSTVEIVTTWTKTGVAGAGTYRPKLGGSSGTSLGTVTHTASNTAAQYLTRFQVGAAYNAQGGYGGGSTPFGGTTAATPTATKDLSASQDLSLCMQLASAADSMTLTSYQVTLYTN